MRALVLVLLAASVAAQPVASSYTTADAVLADFAIDSVMVLAPADWEPPPGLYVAGVAVDVVGVLGGSAVAGLGLYALTQLDEAGLGAPAVLGVGFMLVVAGGAALGAGTYDLARVARGDDPWLARTFDPTRPRSGRYPPRYPRPPYGP